jgi:hypothetical protein
MAVTGGTPDVTVGDPGRLDTNRAKSRFGVAYVRAVCSQARVGFDETSPDEDVQAVDGLVKLRNGPVYVQVKATSQYKIRGRSATWSAEPQWHSSWRECGLPVYFVLVIVEMPDCSAWLDQQPAGTWQRTAAFWARVDQLSYTGGILIPKSQRLTAQTMRVWAADWRRGFSPIGGHNAV